MKARLRNKARRAVRQAEAKERQAAHDKLTTEEKITKACIRLAPGFARRELDRLGAFDDIE